MSPSMDFWVLAGRAGSRVSAHPLSRGVIYHAGGGRLTQSVLQVRALPSDQFLSVRRGRNWCVRRTQGINHAFSQLRFPTDRAIAQVSGDRAYIAEE